MGLSHPWEQSQHLVLPIPSYSGKPTLALSESGPLLQILYNLLATFCALTGIIQ